MKKADTAQLDGVGDWPLAGLVRRPAASEGSFGSIAFSFGLALRRTDETVIVQMASTHSPAELLEQLRPIGVERLTLGRTMCRARAVSFDVALHAVVFELYRPEPEVGVTPEDLASAA
ncbi:Hypothetical protein A7982_07034 [Minicystis rosea]|nr:Hypothetical protein A7982_07034 [Minicystis rosea]